MGTESQRHIQEDQRWVSESDACSFVKQMLAEGPRGPALHGHRNAAVDERATATLHSEGDRLHHGLSRTQG